MKHSVNHRQIPAKVLSFLSFRRIVRRYRRLSLLSRTLIWLHVLIIAAGGAMVGFVEYVRRDVARTISTGAMRPEFYRQRLLDKLRFSHIERDEDGWPVICVSIDKRENQPRQSGAWKNPPFTFIWSPRSQDVTHYEYHATNFSGQVVSQRGPFRRFGIMALSEDALLGPAYPGEPARVEVLFKRRKAGSTPFQQLFINDRRITGAYGSTQALELDPGPYRFRIMQDYHVVMDKQVILRNGERLMFSLPMNQKQ